MNIKPQILLVLVLILSLAIQGCQPEQTPDPTSTATSLPTSTPTVTFTPTITNTPTQTLTPTLTFTPSPVPSLPPGVENSVLANFMYTTAYYSPTFDFTSHEVKGVSHWATHLQNTADNSQSPVYGLGLEFKADVEKVGDNIRMDLMTMEKYPNYKWFFGEVPEEPLRDVYMSEAYIESAEGYSVPFTPPFDAKITHDKTSFTQSDVQIVTITITPRGVMNFGNITVHVRPHMGNVDVKVIDPLPGEITSDKGEIISVSPDSENIFVSGLPLKENEPYEFKFSLQVDPHEQNIKYTPYISIGCGSSTPNFKLEGGTERGNSLTFAMKNAGTWTWTAVGNYKWEWHGASDVVIYNVNFGDHSWGE